MHFDIFCRVIDNFGDIGVCWRLARQLADLSSDHHITLWVDDLSRFQRIEPRVLDRPVQQLTPRLKVVHWTNNPALFEPGDVVIEAFNCDPPESFVQAMVKRNSLWINLEYLSAEAWVEDCHALPSLQSNGLRKFFFFPGFTPRTGGLLREPRLLRQHDLWLSQPQLRLALLKQLGVSETHLQGLQNGWRQALLFGYPSAPVNGLIQALKASHTPWLLLVPQGMHPGLVVHTNQHLCIVEIPFVSQDDFDRLLWSSDLNFVRGEDSLVRALWAGKPMVWQIYEQTEDTHLIKLQAWLKLSPYSGTTRRLMMAWNNQAEKQVEDTLATLLDGPTWADWQAQASAWTQQLAKQPSLVQSLEAFCAKNRQTS